jgi:hypothetical protein
MMDKREQLIEALEANDIDPDFDKWRDSQQLGAAVREAVQ